MNKTIYILQKELPDSKIGDEYIWYDGETVESAYYKDGDIDKSYWTKEHVENNPTWFKLKEQERIVILNLEESAGMENGYFFIASNKISFKKFPAIIKAIELVINGDKSLQESIQRTFDEFNKMVIDCDSSNIKRYPTEILDTLSEDLFAMQSKYKYTEEDMRICFEQSRLELKDSKTPNYYFKDADEYLKSLNQ